MTSAQSLDQPGYKYCPPGFIKHCINPKNVGNAFMLIATHGEIISGISIADCPFTMAMCYSGVAITVNYADDDVNKQVLDILDKSKHFDTVCKLNPTNFPAIKSELAALSHEIKIKDSQHRAPSTNSSEENQVKDSARSWFWSQSFPFTKIQKVSGRISIEHPNKRYTLRTLNFDDADGHRIDDPAGTEVAHGDYEFKMNLFIPMEHTTFETHIRGLETDHQIVIVDSTNVKSIINGIKGIDIATVFGQSAHHVLNPDLPDNILTHWKIILIQVGSRVTPGYLMLPYRKIILSGRECVVFDVWHILCYQNASSYSQNGLSMTTTRDYMELIHLLGIKLLMGVDLTCNVIGTVDGGWPSLTYDQIVKDYEFQEHFFEWDTARHSRRLDRDLFPHMYATKIELNKFLAFMEDNLQQVSESIHPHLVLAHASNSVYNDNESFSELYNALYEFVKRLSVSTQLGPNETRDRECRYLRLIMKDPAKKRIPMDSTQIEHFFSLIPPTNPNHTHIRQLCQYVKESGIRFDLTLEQRSRISQSGHLAGTYTGIVKHFIKEEKEIEEERKEAARLHNKGGGSRNKRRTRRHRLKKRTSKRSLTSRNNRRLRKRSHTRRRR